MSAKEFFSSHGEKVAIALVVVLCSWLLYDLANDRSIRPKDDASQETITRSIIDIQNARNTDTPPMIDAPRGYAGDIQTHWSAELTSDSYLAWLSTPIDVGPPDHDKLFLYIYELLPPKVTATDNIGSVTLTISPPVAAPSNDPRISSVANWAPASTTHQDRTVTNSAQLVGAILQVESGGGGWQPVQALNLGKDGFLPFDDSSPGSPHSVTIETTEPWVRHVYRACLVAKATGYQLVKPADGSAVPDQTVLVTAAPWPDDPPDWDTITSKIAGPIPDPDMAAKFLVGRTDGPGSKSLKPGELAYTGTFGDGCEISPGSLIRFVFIKPMENLATVSGPAPATPPAGEPGDPAAGAALPGSSDADGTPAAPPPANPVPPPVLAAPVMAGAQMEFTKKIRDAQDTVGKWIKHPITKKIKLGESLMFKKEKIDNPLATQADEKKMEEDFITPFTLASVKSVQRTLYWSITTVGRPGGGRKLLLTAKAVPSQVAELTGPGGLTMDLIKLTIIQVPKRREQIVFPTFPSNNYNEADEFRKDPEGFKQWGLVPPKPIEHAQDTGPLEDNRKKTGDDALRTNDTYYELPNGQLVFWDNVNNRLRTFNIPGSEADLAETANHAAPVPTDTAPGNKPAPDHGPSGHPIAPLHPPTGPSAPTIPGQGKSQVPN